MMAAKSHIRARKDPVEVIYMQMEWIGKDVCDLYFSESTFLADEKTELVKALTTIKNLSVNELIAFKVNFRNRFAQSVLKKYELRNRSFRTEILVEIAAEFGFGWKEEMNCWRW